MLVDFDIDGGYRAVAKQEESLEALLNEYQKAHPNVVGTTLDIRERRGATMPNLATMKLKNA